MQVPQLVKLDLNCKHHNKRIAEQGNDNALVLMMCVLLQVGLCVEGESEGGGINSPVRHTWPAPMEAQSSLFSPHLRRLLADEDVYMQE